MSPPTRSAKTSFLLVLFAFLALATFRILGPSDLYDKEQPRTISYTADILLHHRWILPTDTFDIPATKPPLFNWIDAPVVAIFGYHEWALKFPSLLAALLVLICIQKAANPLASPPDVTGAADITAIATLASLLWLASFMTAKLMYLARPDMLVTAFLTLAWISATEIILNPTPRRGTIILLWLSIAAAALTKGPIALLPIAYLILGAKILTKSFQPLKRAGLWWGIPLLLLTFGTWSFLAHQQDPDFFRQVLVGRELLQHLAGGNENAGHKPFRWLLTLPNGPIYIIARFLPWSLLPLAAFICWILRKFNRRPATTAAPVISPLAPAVFWITVIILSFCFLSTKRPDRYAPIFPPLALITAYLALHLPQKFRMPNSTFRIAPLLFIAVVCLYNQFLDNPAKTKWGNNVAAFTTAVAEKTADATILFEDGEQSPLQTLLGRHEPLTPSLETQQTAQWCIKFYDPAQKAPSSPPALVSAPIAQIDGPNPGRLALYPLTPPQGVEECQAAQQLPRIYADDNSNQLSTLPSEGARWLQFWRQHTR